MLDKEQAKARAHQLGVQWRYLNDHWVLTFQDAKAVAKVYNTETDFSYFWLYLYRLRKNRLISPDVWQIFKCTECQEVLSRSRLGEKALFDHIKGHGATSPACCRECNLLFKSYEVLEAHRQSDHPLKSSAPPLLRGKRSKLNHASQHWAVDKKGGAWFFYFAFKRYLTVALVDNKWVADIPAGYLILYQAGIK